MEVPLVALNLQIRDERKTWVKRDTAVAESERFGDAGEWVGNGAPEMQMLRVFAGLERTVAKMQAGGKKSCRVVHQIVSVMALTHIALEPAVPALKQGVILF